MNQVKSISTDEYGNPINSLSTYSGDWSLQQVFAGLGFKVFENLSVGANFSYLYGDITHSVNTTFSNTNSYSSVRSEKMEISDYKLDFGLQYTHNFGKKHKINLIKQKIFVPLSQQTNKPTNKFSNYLIKSKK